MAEKTPWFPGDVKPVHVGIYERDDRGTKMYDGRPNFSYWNGHSWCWASADIKYALQDGTSQLQNLPWRGLAQKAGQ